MLDELMERANADPAFSEIQQRFGGAGIESWVRDEEKALHFAVGAYAPGDGVIVEIGSFKGGSACFLGAGLNRRGRGRLTCIDPHLGGPTWMGMCPAQYTLDEFRRGTRECGVDEWIDARLGESSAVAAIWPAEPLDAVFIDGDHSFLGALRDYECWGPKVKPGGLVMIDDVDDPGNPGLLEMLELVGGLKAVRHLKTIQGIAVYERTDLPSWTMLDELSETCAKRGTYRPWDWSFLHQRGLSSRYLQSKTWGDPDFDEAYKLCFLARCGAGPYGYSSGSATEDRAVLHALSRDRGDGEVVEIGGLSETIRRVLRQPSARYRAIVCRPEEARDLAPRLLPNGVLIARSRSVCDTAQKYAVRDRLVEAGLEGCGFNWSLHWGVWQPEQLSPEAVLNYAFTGVS